MHVESSCCTMRSGSACTAGSVGCVGVGTATFSLRGWSSSSMLRSKLSDLCFTTSSDISSPHSTEKGAQDRGSNLLRIRSNFRTRLESTRRLWKRTAPPPPGETSSSVSSNTEVTSWNRHRLAQVAFRGLTASASQRASASRIQGDIWPPWATPRPRRSRLQLPLKALFWGLWGFGL